VISIAIGRGDVTDLVVQGHDEEEVPAVDATHGQSDAGLRHVGASRTDRAAATPVPCDA